MSSQSYSVETVDLVTKPIACAFILELSDLANACLYLIYGTQ